MSVFSAGVVLTVMVWRVGIGRADGWWSRPMGALTSTYLTVVAAFVYGLGVVA